MKFFLKHKNMLQLPDVEKVAEEVHNAWMQTKIKHGYTSRKAEDGEELMVPYAKLSEKAKDLDRNSVLAIYAAIKKLQT
jgi:hypothetical protein